MLDENKQIEKLSKPFKSPYFPWFSSIVSLFIIAYLLINNDPELKLFYNMQDSVANITFNIFIIVFVGLVYWIDAKIFMIRRDQTNSHISRIKEQLKLVTQSKKKQQLRANTSSDHTEKLKLFISDKLIEYMDYDEKFIHFKGIASEVRHNGVISYDKVMTALHTAIEQQNFLSLYEQSHDTDSTEPNKHTINALTDYRSALDAMRYLWVLLDLSTADNMSIHISNQLIECEEHYYQLQLDSQQSLDMTQSIPTLPTFHPQTATLMALAMISNDSEIKQLIALIKINPSILEKPFFFENEQFRISLENTPELLGNHNHVILLLENLIKNAQFFSHKTRYKQKSDRIIIVLKPESDNAHLSIYNRGPHIQTEDIDDIFKLGFSTRNKSSQKNKIHHGKGLGLFFSREIVKGYQGTIEAINIKNTQCDYLLMLVLASGENKSIKINTLFDNHRIKTKLDEENEWQDDVIINTNIPITSIELQCYNNETEKYNPSEYSPTIDQLIKFEWCSLSKELINHWNISLKPFKKNHQLTFKALDVCGVKFDIKLPTAESSLNE